MSSWSSFPEQNNLIFSEGFNSALIKASKKTTKIGGKDHLFILFLGGVGLKLHRKCSKKTTGQQKAESETRMFQIKEKQSMGDR